MDGLRIVQEDPAREPIAGLIDYHLAQMRQWSPPEQVHALPAERMRESDVTFFAAWRGERLAGCGAIKALSDGHGELKSMRVAPEFLGTGVGKAILARLLAEARTRGYTRVSLETGRGEPFAAALGLYAKAGFTPCPPFADYVADGFSQCLTLTL